MTQTELNQKLADFRAACQARGESVADYCRKNNLDYDAMNMVMRGRAKGYRGKAHEVMVAIGLKPAPKN